MCPMTPIVWMDRVGVIGVCLSIREETPPGPADGEGGKPRCRCRWWQRQWQWWWRWRYIGVIGVCPSIRTQTPPGRADGEASGRGKGEKRPHEGLIPPQLDQYHECTGLSNTIGWETRKHIHGTGVHLLQTSEQSVVVLQLMVNVAICWDISISSPRREKCIFSEKKILKVPIPPPPCPGVLARRCSCMCWKDELSDGARTRGTEETGI